MRLTISLVGLAALAHLSALAQSNYNAATYPGIDASVKINGCIVAVISAGGGTCDATKLGGMQKMSQSIRLGSPASVKDRIGITLLLPDTGVWSWHLTDGSSCGIYQYSSTSIIGNQPGGGGNRIVLAADSGSKMDAIYCTDASPIGADYVRAEGFSVWNNQAGSTFQNGVIHIRDAVDQSSFARIFGENYYGDVWHVESACCGVKFENIHATSNGSIVKNGSKGGVPLTIGPGKVRAISFYDSSVNQPGNGSPDILIKGGNVMAVNFFDLYMEGNGGIDDKTPMVFIAPDVGPIHFFGGFANTEQGPLKATKAVFESHGLGLEVSGIETANTSLGINDVTAGVKVESHAFKGNLGTISPYRTGRTEPAR
ncbi:MAG TPA: hypothetical protein VHT28_15700 [Silvibacterium sp.]|jgi:hypothetical protein|nr:hypothetical protein [Silvibacterium sp.]